MPLLLLILALLSLVNLGAVALSIVLGAVLCITKRFRTVGIFVLLVPTLSAAFATAFSRGAALLVDSLSHGASPADMQRRQALALWAWLVGLVGGGMAGGVFGILVGTLIVRRARLGNVDVPVIASGLLKLATVEGTASSHPALAWNRESGGDDCRGLSRPHPSRLATHCDPQHGPPRRAGTRRHQAHRAQNAVDLPTLQYRFGWRSSDCGGSASRPN